MTPKRVGLGVALIAAWSALGVTVSLIAAGEPESKTLEIGLALLTTFGGGAVGGLIAYWSIQAGARRAFQYEMELRTIELRHGEAHEVAESMLLVRDSLRTVQTLFERVRHNEDLHSAFRSRAFGESREYLGQAMRDIELVIRRPRHRLNGTPVPEAVKNLAFCLAALVRTMNDLSERGPSAHGVIADVADHLCLTAGWLAWLCDGITADLDRELPIEVWTEQKMLAQLGLEPVETEPPEQPSKP